MRARIPCLIEKLRRHVASRRVVAVVGTGVSVATCANQKVDGYAVATWTGLLEHGLHYCRTLGLVDAEDESIIGQQITSGKTSFLIAAAEQISMRLRSRDPGVYRGWLKDTVGALKVHEPALIETLASVAGVLATLNYDNLVEDVTGRRALTWLDKDQVQDALWPFEAFRTPFGAKAVVHLHGWYQQPDSVVLGLSSYIGVRDHAHARAVLELFTIDRTLLFVGCGDTLADPNFTRLLEWASEAHADVAPRHHFLCLASEVDESRARLARVPWLQPLAYGARYSDLLPFLRQLVATEPMNVGARASALSLDLAAYQHAMHKHYRRLDVAELHSDASELGWLALSEAFIPQLTRECASFPPRIFELPKELQRRLLEDGELDGRRLEDARWKVQRKAYLAQVPQSVLRVIDDEKVRRLILLGDPGSGKSTLLRYLVLRWAEMGAGKAAALPLLVELSEYARLRARDEIRDLLDYFEHGASVRYHLEREAIEHWWRENDTLVLFDGLDEVLDRQIQRELSIAIPRFAESHPRVRVVVTSRVVGFRPHSWQDEGFRQFILEGFSDPQIAEFLRRWSRHAVEGSSTARGLSALKRAIEEAPAIRELVSNPLLLTLTAFLSRTEALPRHRAALYEECASLLLQRWKTDLALESDRELAKASLDFIDKRALLAKVARAMQSSEGSFAANLIDEGTLDRTLTEALRGFPDLRPDRAARALVNQLRGRSFVLSSVGAGWYAFVHRSFLEYFCACEIRDRFESQRSLSLEGLTTEVFGRWSDPTWHEVLSLLAGMLAPRFVAPLIQHLLSQPDPEHTCQAVFLAARCVAEVRKPDDLGPAAAQTLERIKALVRFRFPFAEGDQAGDWYHYKERLKTTRRRAVELSVSCWRNRSELFLWLKSLAEHDRDEDVRVSAMRELVRGWKSVPETRALLHRQAEFDDSVTIRQAAMLQLAQAFEADQETLRIVIAQVGADPSYKVRTAALEELLSRWRDSPETLPLLKELAQAEEDDIVRCEALSALVNGWPNDPETYPIVRSIVATRPSNSTIPTALGLLNLYWGNEPSTLSILKSWAGIGPHLPREEELNNEDEEDEDGEDEEDWDCRLQALTLLLLRESNHSNASQWVREVIEAELDGTCRSRFVQEFGFRSNPEFLNELAKHDPDPDVRCEAAVCLGDHFSDAPETLQTLQELARSDPEPTTRFRVGTVLMRFSQIRSEALAIVTAQATSDPSEAVRANAARELIDREQEAPESLTIVMDLAANASAADVRANMLAMLASHWKGSPEELRSRLHAALSDESTQVRCVALHEIVQRFRDNSATLPIVKATAMDVQAPKELRGRAIRELARGWSSDAEIPRLLEQLARSDPNDGPGQDHVDFNDRGFWRHHKDVIEVAIDEWVRGWQDDRVALPCIVEVVLAYGPNSLEDAVKELLQGSSTTPALLPFLQALATREELGCTESPLVLRQQWRRARGTPEGRKVLEAATQNNDHAVRGQVLLELARNWKDSPNTLVLLQGAAEHDEYPEVRRRALLELERGWSGDPELAQFVARCRTRLRKPLQLELFRVAAEDRVADSFLDES